MNTIFCDIFHPLNYDFAIYRASIKRLFKVIEEPTKEQKERLSKMLEKFNHAGAIKKGIYPAQMAERLVNRIV